jgi:hypothetical protein
MPKMGLLRKTLDVVSTELGKAVESVEESSNEADETPSNRGDTEQVA